jgi:DNA-binding transcriptional MerR regulator
VATVADGYRIGEVAAATGFPASTLRYYEDEGLLPAPDRTASGQRVHGDAHVARLRFMARAKRLGLRLEEIAELARAWDDEPCAITHSQLVGLLDGKLTQVHDEIVELTRFADQLAAVFERVAGRPAEHGRCGPECGCASVLADDPPALADDAPAQPVDRSVGALPVAARG